MSKCDATRFVPTLIFAAELTLVPNVKPASMRKLFDHLLNRWTKHNFNNCCPYHCCILFDLFPLLLLTASKNVDVGWGLLIRAWIQSWFVIWERTHILNFVLQYLSRNRSISISVHLKNTFFIAY